MSIEDYLIQKFNIKNTNSPISIPVGKDGLVKLWMKFGYKVGVEIGVDRGKFSKYILKTLKPGAKLYCVDPWEVYDEYYERKGDRGKDALSWRYEETKIRLAPYNAEIIRKQSMDAVKDFMDNSLDFVFIDGNHTFEYCIKDIMEWSKKVKVGGMVCGHDYWNSAEGFGNSKLPIERYIKHLTPKEKIMICGVKDAVHAWTNTNQIHPWFLTGGDDYSTYFWVKHD